MINSITVNGTTYALAEDTYHVGCGACALLFDCSRRKEHGVMCKWFDPAAAEGEKEYIFVKAEGGAA